MQDLDSNKKKTMLGLNRFRMNQIRWMNSKRLLSECFDTPLTVLDTRIGSTGLFGYSRLNSPDGFVAAAKVALNKGQQIVDMVCNAVECDDRNELRKAVKRLDVLSDTLCAVLDTAELIRNVHPDSQVVTAANKAHSILNTFLNQLNTHRGLYAALKRITADQQLRNSLSPEEARVTQLLMTDFEKSGIHMPQKTRRQFVELNDRIMALGQQFTLNAFPSINKIRIDNPQEELQGLPASLIEGVMRSGRGSKHAYVSTAPDIASAVLLLCRNETTRRRMFMATHSASESQLDVLQEMLVRRGQLAALLGKPSYAHMFLVDKMASTPENVFCFLESLAQDNKPLADAECSRLSALKRVHTGNQGPINAWDRSYYTRFLASQPGCDAHRDECVSAYFTVGNTFEGLSSVFTSLYGVRLEPDSVTNGEVWHKDVRKLNVIHEIEGKLGTIYCDLFQRCDDSRKYEHPAHFTIRCSRRIDDDGYAGVEMDDTMQSRQHIKQTYLPTGERGKAYQLPIVVLVTGFERPQAGRPALLQLQDIDTLFHEMGHAMHSMLAKTDFQHIAGTRVAIDFVEVPSILTEYLSKTPHVLASFGRHYQTNEKVSVGLLEARRANSASLDALEMQQQLQLALLDQMYHSSQASPQKSFDSTQILCDLQNRINPIPYVAGTHWQVQFSHLFSYGASYYSYFWCRRWASRIYRKLFAGKPMEQWREGGEEFKQHVLRWGGGQDPWIGLQSIGVVNEGDREGRSKSKLEDLQLDAKH